MSIQKGETRFESNGKGYILKFTFNAFCDLEDAFDMSIQRILDKFSKGENEVDVSLRDIRTMMRCGLNHGGNDNQVFTDDETGKIIQGIGGRFEAFDVISTAFMVGFSDGAEKSKKVAEEPEAISQ